METITKYKAERFFEGINPKGETQKYAPNDIIEGVENWPTFEALKRIKWISPISVTVQPQVASKKETKKVEEKQPEVDHDPFKEFTKELEEMDKKKETEVKIEEVKSEEKVQCDHCGKPFDSKRALSVHIKRSHS